MEISINWKIEKRNLKEEETWKHIGELVRHFLDPAVTCISKRSLLYNSDNSLITRRIDTRLCSVILDDQPVDDEALGTRQSIRLSIRRGIR